MIESQRRLAELGLFRRVRITELPRTGSLTRDVLVDLEEAARHDHRLRRRCRGRPHRRDRRRGICHRRARHRAARLLRDQPAEPVGQEPLGHAVWQRHAVGRDREEEADPIDEERGYGFHDYRGLFTFREPRAFGTTGDAQFTAFVEQARRTSFSFNRKGVTSDYARRIAAIHGHRPLYLRLHEARSTSRSRPKISC